MLRQFIILGILTVTLGTPALCRAEGTQGASSVKPAEPRRVGPPKELKHEVLKYAPTDLKVPLPPDITYLSGYRSQYSITKLITEIRFKTVNPVQTVSDWYEKSLAGAGWKVTASKTGTMTSLMAFRQNLVCSLIFRKAADAKDTIVLMNYSEGR